MRSRILAVAGISAAALAAAAAFAGTAGASTNSITVSAHGHAATARTSPAKGGAACFSNAGTDADDAILSANFSDTGDNIYDSQGASDFSVASKCKIGAVVAPGQYFTGSGPANDVNLYIYKDKKKTSLPGKAVVSQTDLSYTGSGLGTLSFNPTKFKLKKGNYFVSVVADMTFATGGEWGWEVQDQQTGNQDLWQNPGGGFGVCPTWGQVETCVGATGPDFMVTLSK